MLKDEWDAATKKCVKIVGPQAKIPKLPGDVTKAFESAWAKYAEFKKIREELKSKISELEDLTDAYSNRLEKFKDQVDESSLGVEGKENAKKVADAKSILSSCLKSEIEAERTNHKNLRDVAKHLANIASYAKGS